MIQEVFRYVLRLDGVRRLSSVEWSVKSSVTERGFGRTHRLDHPYAPMQMPNSLTIRVCDGDLS